MLRTSDLRVREVIDIAEGRRLGPMTDVEVDLATGRVTHIIVPGPGRWFKFLGRDNDYVIPWENIYKVGVDVILVELSSPERERSAGLGFGARDAREARESPSRPPRRRSGEEAGRDEV